MELVQTAEGPRLALNPEAVQILARESTYPLVRQSATAWLDHYRLCRLIGMSDLEARIDAVEAWDNVVGPTIEVQKGTHNV